MSIYTEQKKTKSLWYPITDEDFNLDFGKPIMFCTEEGSLYIVDGLDDLFENYMDEERFFDFKAKTLSEEGKEQLRGDCYGYMYLDEKFYEAIEWAEGKYIEDVKSARERPEVFVMTKVGPRVFSHFDFERDVSPLSYSTNELSKDFAQKYPESYLVDYIVNLEWVPQTSLSALFIAPL